MIIRKQIEGSDALRDAVCVRCGGGILPVQGCAVYSEAIEGTSSDLRTFLATSSGVLQKGDCPTPLLGAVLCCTRCADALFTEKVWEEAQALRVGMEPGEIHTQEGRAARSEVIDFSVALPAKRRGWDAVRSRHEAERLGALWITDRSEAVTRLSELGSVLATGRFVQRQVASFKGQGRYQGPGSLEVAVTGLKVVGSHVYPLRWRLSALLFASVGIFALAGGAYFAIPILPIGLITRYLVLKEENLEISFSQVTGIAIDGTREIVAVSFADHPYCSPVVLKSVDFRAVADALYSAVPDAQLAGQVEPSASVLRDKW